VGEGPTEAWEDEVISRAVEQSLEALSKVGSSAGQECFASCCLVDFVDRPWLTGQRKRSMKSHELNTKLATTEIDF
jgi:hypothetical protein